MATEKELHKCKIELNSYKLNSSNIPIENKTQKDDQSEDSLLAKERFHQSPERLGFESCLLQIFFPQKMVRSYIRREVGGQK